MYSNIINPVTNQKVSIFSEKGLKLLKSYIKNINTNGGEDICKVNRRTGRCSKKGTQSPELCMVNDNNRCVKRRQQQPRRRQQQPRRRQQPIQARNRNVCKKFRKTKAPRCERQPNCRWVRGSGCQSINEEGSVADFVHSMVENQARPQPQPQPQPQARPQPQPQALVGNQAPIVLNLKLTSNADPTGALHKQEDLIDKFNEVCPNYDTIYHEFNDFSDIERILSRLSNRKIAQLIILTHGSPNSIVTGRNEYMVATPVSNDHFKRFIELLKPMLLPRANIMLTACLTGKNMLFDHLETQRLRSLFIKNMEIDNFANKLAKELTGHEIYCTPKTQVANELELVPIGKRNETEICNENNERPVNWGYLSRYQIMFIYYHDDTNKSEIKFNI